jgi:hypothetical protein
MIDIETEMIEMTETEDSQEEADLNLQTFAIIAEKQVIGKCHIKFKFCLI